MAWVSDKDCYFLCKDNFLWTNFMRIVFPADMKSAFLTICSSRTANWAKLKAQVFDRLSRCRLRAKRLLSCLFKRAAGRWKSPILRLSTFNLTLFVVLSELSPVFWFSFSFQSSASSVTSFSISSACLLPRWGFLRSQELARFKFEQDQDQALRFPPLTPTFSLQPQLGLHFSKRPDRLVSRFWLHGFRDFQAAVPWDCFTAPLASWLSWFLSNRHQIALFLPPLLFYPTLFRADHLF